MPVTPIRLRDHDKMMDVDRLRVIGYRASCGLCPWIGSVRKSVALARADENEHACQDNAA